MGVSGGVKGVLDGPSIMIGGDTNAFDQVKNIFSQITSKTIIDSKSFEYFGDSNQGHFVKAQELSQINFKNTLHVGDHPMNDIWGARELGINVMWFNINNLDWDIDENPPIQFKIWADFINLLEENYGK
mgnify:CR=1 FL=1